MEVLIIMIKKKKVEDPFKSFPPEGALKKISIYDIPYDIRLEIENMKTKRKSICEGIKKENSIKVSNADSINIMKTILDTTSFLV